MYEYKCTVLRIIEGDTLYVDVDYEDFIKKEQPNTTITLSEKIFSIDVEKKNDIIVSELKKDYHST